MTGARQRAANRRNSARSTGPRSGSGCQRVATNATRHGLHARFTRDELDTALVDILARLGRTAKSLSGEERAAAEALACAAVVRARVRKTEHALLGALDYESAWATDDAAANEREIEAILAEFRNDGVDARHLRGFAGAPQREADALHRLLRYRSRAETVWRKALLQWARATRPDAVHCRTSGKM